MRFDSTFSPSDPKLLRLALSLGAGLLLAFGTGPNFLMASLACVVLVVGMMALWRPGEPPVLLYVFLFQWVQSSILVFYGNFNDIPVNKLTSNNLELAFLLTMVSLGFFAMGLRVGAGPTFAHQIQTRNFLIGLGQLHWAQIYLVAWVIATASLALAAVLPGFSQPLLALASVKWAAFLIFTIVTFASPRSSRLLWAVAFAVELVLSLGGYFATFKSVFVFTLFGLAAAGVRLTRLKILRLAGFIILLIIFSLYWTAIKPEYRAFVSGGEVNQSVIVSQFEAVGKIVELVSIVESAELREAAETIMYRLDEIVNFSSVLTYVPSVVPHEHGVIWWDAFARPFMPRILFPNKEIIDESAMTRKYTGINVAGLEQGTQISLGYVADSYIDFGEFGMMIAIYIFAYFLGYVYRALNTNRNSHGLIGMSMAVATISQIESIATSSAKAVGGIIVSAIVFQLILKFFVPRYIMEVKS